MVIENKLNIGSGIYTIPDISRILRLPYHKVNFWVNKYWDGELGKEFQHQYSWCVDKTKAISFHTLIEFYVLYQFAEAGVKTRQVLNAHIELSKYFETQFPFAQKEIIENIKTDGRKIYLEFKENILSLDGNKQFNLSFIEIFFKSLDFDNEFLATKFWPLGKTKSIVIDPKRQFGQPVIGNTNIYPETLFNLYKGGDSIDFIAFTYDLEKHQVIDAIDFCNAA
ncbi:MAG: DUF433 domain-containing protein [Cyclobacteriaceae bacterium]